MSIPCVDIIDDFWRSSDERLDQKFYAVYSIFSSAILDYAVARHLQRRKIYDWSIAAYYYSILHSTRLLSFIAIGDFPKSHGEMISFLTEGTWIWERGRGWWWKIASESGDEDELRRSTRGRFCITTGCLASRLEKYGLCLSEERIRHLGEVLEEAKKIRESVNYEGLLIIHQFWHYVLNPQIERAVDLMQRTSRSFLEQYAVRAFLAFVDPSRQEEKHRGKKWISFLLFEGREEEIRNNVSVWTIGPDMNYGMNRLTGILNEKYEVEDSIRREVSEFLEPIFDLGRRYEIREGDAREVFKNISLSVFEGKRALIQNFENHVVSLERKTGLK